MEAGWRSSAEATHAPGRALKILAKSIYKELRHNGYTRSEIVAFSTELLGLVTSEIKGDEAEENPSAS